MVVRNIKILYVDDEEINLEVFNAVFKRNFSVYTALSGQSGLDILNNNSEIRIVISDMRMPEMNGVEFITQARQTFDHIIYFILTGYEVDDEISSAVDNKIVDKYFKKPFKRSELLSEIKKAISD